MASPATSTESAEPLLQFKKVRKAFGQKVIYDGLDLDIRAGESLTIIGGSGVGKSVMLKMLIGLLKVDSGSILFHGQDITKMGTPELATVRQSIGMLFQGAALFDSISVGANVAYGLHEHFHNRMSQTEIAERVAWALGLVGLPGIEDMRPADLSGGMKKRVGLARAIAVRPEVILFDEPTTAAKSSPKGRPTSSRPSITNGCPTSFMVGPRRTKTSRRSSAGKGRC
jgi:phospholipid/cholesterol/gamma-HCH transport system ATP-binding protein